MDRAWVEEKLAHQVARLSSLQSALDISSVASETGKTVEQASKLYFNLGDRLSLHWFLKQINSQAVDNNWQALARAAFRRPRLATTSVDSASSQLCVCKRRS